MIEILLIIFSISLLALSLATMMDSFVRNLIYQAILLSLITFFSHESKSIVTVVFVLIETILIKGIIVPYILLRNIKENEIVREVEANVPQYLSILAMSLILICGFVIAYWTKTHIKEINSLQFGISISTILAGFFLIIVRKQLITHVVGYMIIENGTFLLSLTIIGNLPILVALGISLDILMGILLAGILINHIKEEFIEEEGIDSLTTLKD